MHTDRPLQRSAGVAYTAVKIQQHMHLLLVYSMYSHVSMEMEKKTGSAGSSKIVLNNENYLYSEVKKNQISLLDRGFWVCAV